MRVLVIVAAALALCVAAAAARAPARTPGLSQTALAVPLPAGANPKGGTSLAQVVCPSKDGCVAFGTYTSRRPAGRRTLVLVWRAGGRWTASRELVPAGLTTAACPALGSCVGARSGERRGYVLSEQGRRWAETPVQLPGSPNSAWPTLSSVSCGSPGNCTAVGSFRNPVLEPLVVSESVGRWQAGVSPPLPPTAATAPAAGSTDAGGGLSLVSCPQAGTCAAVGTYTDEASSGQDGWLLDERAGQWGAGETMPLPADAAPFGDPERGGTSPFFGFSGLACPSAGECTAVGGYWGRGDVEQGLIETEHDGVWMPAVRAPVPSNAGLNTASANAFESPLEAVACAAAGDCAAAGWYLDTEGRRHGLLLSEHGGVWQARELRLPSGVSPGAGVDLRSVACPAPGACVAVGETVDHGRARGLLVAERGGVWARALTAALPANARGGRSVLTSVACVSSRRCTAVGYSVARSGRTRGLLIGLSFAR